MENLRLILLVISFCCAVVGFVILISLTIKDATASNGRRKVTAVLQCTDCLNDQQVVTQYLLNNGLTVVKTKMCSEIYTKITVRAESVDHLMSTVRKANAGSTYGVTVLKIKEN